MSSSSSSNTTLSTYMLASYGAVFVAVMTWRVVDIANKYSRIIACLGNRQQRYFSLPSPSFALIKRRILYAPALSSGHDLRIQLSSVVNFGTLPTRFQLLFLSAYLLINVFFCVIKIPFSGPYEAATRQLRDRSGILATVNMVDFVLLPAPT